MKNFESLFAELQAKAAAGNPDSGTVKELQKKLIDLQSRVVLPLPDLRNINRKMSAGEMKARKAKRDASALNSEAYGEGKDAGDKALAKAQSVSFRTALFSQFVVPTQAVFLDIEEDSQDAYEVLLDEAREAALGGIAAYSKFFMETCSAQQRVMLKKDHATLKKNAAAVDAKKAK